MSKSQKESKSHSMSKSHYFVAPSKIPEGYNRCYYCDKIYKLSEGRQKFCSEECWKKHRKKYYADWFQANKKHHNEKRKESLRRRLAKQPKKKKKKKYKINELKKYHAEKKLKKKKCRLIKEQLVNLELMGEQLNNQIHPELDFIHFNKGVNWDKVDYIGDKLGEYELYYTQIIDNYQKYQLDFSRDREDWKMY